MSRQEAIDKFKAWVKEEMNVTLLTDEGPKALPEDELMAMACAMRTHVVYDLAHAPNHAILESEMLARLIPPGIPLDGNGAPIRIFAKAIVKALADVTGEIERGPPSITLKLTEEGLRNVDGTTRSGKTIFPLDNGRGR